MCLLFPPLALTHNMKSLIYKIVNPQPSYLCVISSHCQQSPLVPCRPSMCTSVARYILRRTIEESGTFRCNKWAKSHLSGEFWDSGQPKNDLEKKQRLRVCTVPWPQRLLISWEEIERTLYLLKKWISLINITWEIQIAFWWAPQMN